MLRCEKQRLLRATAVLHFCCTILAEYRTQRIRQEETATKPPHTNRLAQSQSTRIWYYSIHKHIYGQPPFTAGDAVLVYNHAATAAAGIELSRCCEIPDWIFLCLLPPADPPTGASPTKGAADYIGERSEIVTSARQTNLFGT